VPSVRAILPTLQSRHQFPSLHDIIFSRDDTVSHPLNRSTSKVFHLISIACSVYWALGLGWCCARGELSRHAWMLCLPCCQTASMICNLPLFILGCLTLSLANILAGSGQHILSQICSSFTKHLPNFKQLFTSLQIDFVSQTKRRICSSLSVTQGQINHAH